MPSWLLISFPVIAALLGSIVATVLRPSAWVVSGVRHFAAGVVFAAAAGEILPDVVHGGAPVLPTFIGGSLGVILMLLGKKAEEWSPGPTGLIVAIGIDILVDGVVLGISILAGEKAGLLIAVALTLEILSLGLVLTTSLGEFIRSPVRIVVSIVGLTLLLPLGALLATPASMLPPAIFTGLLASALMALLYLVTEELLVEAHEVKDTPLITSMFFVGFLALLILEEVIK